MSVPNRRQRVTVPDLAARKGGTIVMTGLARYDTEAPVRTFPFVMHEKRLIGSVYGSSDPLQDIAKIREVSFVMKGGAVARAP